MKIIILLNNDNASNDSYNTTIDTIITWSKICKKKTNSGPGGSLSDCENKNVMKFILSIIPFRIYWYVPNQFWTFSYIRNMFQDFGCPNLNFRILNSELRNKKK